MSIKRLNAEERAVYLIGLAIMRQIRDETRDPDTIKELNVVYRWLEHWLTDDELCHITKMTGILFDHDLDEIHDILAPNFPRPDFKDDGSDTPF